MDEFDRLINDAIDSKLSEDGTQKKDFNNYHFEWFENSVKNDAAEETIHYQQSKHKSKKSTAKKIIALSTAVLCAVAMFQAGHHYKKEVDLREYLRENYSTVLSDNTYSVGGGNFAYDTDSIADFINSQENIDNVLYGVYSQMPFNRHANTDKIVSKLKNDEGDVVYKNFDDYLTSKGFENEEDYQNKMNEIMMEQMNSSKSNSK